MFVVLYYRVFICDVLAVHKKIVLGDGIRLLATLLSCT